MHATFYADWEIFHVLIKDPWHPRWETGVIDNLYYGIYHSHLSGMLKTQGTQSTFSTTRYRYGRSGPKILTSPISPLFDDIDPTSLSYRLLFQTLTYVYQLLNNSLPDHFEEDWLCVPLGSNSQPPFVTSSFVLLDSLISLLLNCSEPNITTSPLLSHMSLFGIADYFNIFVGTLGSTDCDNTILLDTTTQPPCPNIHNASILCGTQRYHCLPTRWSGTCVLVFLFPKLWVTPGKEPLPITITGLIAASHDKWAVQVMPFLVALSITACVTTGVAGLTAFLAIYHGLSSQFIQDIQWVDPEPNRLDGRHSTTKSVRIRFTNNRERWSLSLPRGRFLFLC